MPKPRSPNPHYVLWNTSEDEYRWHIRPKEWSTSQAIGWVDEPYNDGDTWDAVNWDGEERKFPTSREAIIWVIHSYLKKATRR